LWTQFRYNQMKKEGNGEINNQTAINFQKLPKEFRAFQK